MSDGSSKYGTTTSSHTKKLQWLLKNTYIDTTGNSIREDIDGCLEQYIRAAFIYLCLLLAHGFKWLFIKKLVHLVMETCC